ncbi:MAG: PQQ-dependent sugar dehydrogenase [Solirubrobacterales bacterium]
MTDRRPALIGAAMIMLLALALLTTSTGRASGTKAPVAVAKRVVKTNAAVGLSIDSRGRLLYGEHVSGEIVRLSGGKKQVLARISVASNIEPGLLGLATNDSGRVWVSYTTSQGGCPDPTEFKSDPVVVDAICVWRFKPSGSKLKPDKLIFSAYPNGWRSHVGGGLGFGPDGALYFGIGDLGNSDSPSIGPNRSQDLSVPFGKILRLNPNATNRGATGNPKTCGNADNSVQRRIVDKRIYACGFRNPFSFDWDLAGRLWVADVGDSCDEINRVSAGVNFGWQPPRTDCAGAGAGKPILKLKNRATPSGMAIPKSKAAGSARGAVFFGVFRDSLIRRYAIREKKLSTVSGTSGQAGWSLLASGKYLYMSNGDEISRLNLR